MDGDLTEDMGSVRERRVGQYLERRFGQWSAHDQNLGRSDFYLSSFEGKPVVNFDGNDLISSSESYDFNQRGYTMISIARYTGGSS